MIATAVDQHAVSLREEILLAAPRIQVAQRAVHEHDRWGTAVAGKPVRQARAIERHRMQRAIEHPHGWTSRRGCRFLGSRSSTARDDQHAAQQDSHIYRMARRVSKRH